MLNETMRLGASARVRAESVGRCCERPIDRVSESRGRLENEARRPERYRGRFSFLTERRNGRESQASLRLDRWWREAWRSIDRRCDFPSFFALDQRHPPFRTLSLYPPPRSTHLHLSFRPSRPPSIVATFTSVSTFLLATDIHPLLEPTNLRISESLSLLLCFASSRNSNSPSLDRVTIVPQLFDFPFPSLVLVSKITIDVAHPLFFPVFRIDTSTVQCSEIGCPIDDVFFIDTEQRGYRHL